MSTTSNIPVSSGAGVYVGTYSVSEDAVTKQIQRVVLNTGDGSVFGSSTVPIAVSIIGGLTATVSGATSVSGTVGASIIGAVPVTFAASANQSVSGRVDASIVGSVPVFPGAISNTSVYAVLSSVTTVSVMNANTSRKMGTLYNASGTTVYIKMGTAATTSVFSVALNNSDYYELPVGYTGVVAGISASNAGIINVTEYT